MRACVVDGCDRPHRARGWCNGHYEQWRLQGVTPVYPLPPRDHFERFWVGVEITETCWLYRLARDTGGYGRFQIEGVCHAAHRYSYEHLVGPIPEGLQLDHLCRVRNCVNPDHLEPVTPTENVRRGLPFRPPRVQCRHGHALTEENVYMHNGYPHCRVCRKIAQDNWRH